MPDGSFGLPLLSRYRLSSHSTDREHHVTSDPRWTSSPLRSDLGFRYTQPTVRAPDLGLVLRRYVVFGHYGTVFRQPVSRAESSSRQPRASADTTSICFVLVATSRSPRQRFASGFPVAEPPTLPPMDSVPPLNRRRCWIRPDPIPTLAQGARETAQDSPCAIYN